MSSHFYDILFYSLLNSYVNYFDGEINDGNNFPSICAFYDTRVNRYSMVKTEMKMKRKEEICFKGSRHVDTQTGCVTIYELSFIFV